MSWLKFHEISERFASDAHLALQRGETDEAAQLFRSAAEAESQALNEVESGKARTYGITAISAVSLWYKSGDLEAAEQLALKSLASGPVPPFALQQLRELLQTIWTTRSMRNAGVAFLPGQVLVSVRGGQTIVGGAPLDLIVEKVQTVQALFYRTIEYLKHLPHRKRGGPGLEIQEACRPWLFQAPPGSYQFAVAVQEPKQIDFFAAAEPNARQVAEHFLSILKASSVDPAHALSALVPEEDYRGTFLKLTRSLTPTGKNFNEVEVRGAGDVRGIVLAPENRKAINAVLRPKAAQQEPVEEAREELRGILRGLHLEKDWLELSVNGMTVHIDGLSDAVDDLIGPMVNRPVIVQVVRSKSGLRFIDIEPED